MRREPLWTSVAFLLAAGTSLGLEIDAASATEALFLDGFESGFTCQWSWSAATECIPFVASVRDIRKGLVYAAAELPSVLVTAVTADRMHLWVADYGAAFEECEWSGVFARRFSYAPELPAGLDVGSVVRLQGTVAALDPWPNGIGLLVKEIETLGSEPPPIPCSGASVEVLTSADNYNGVLVRVFDLEVAATGEGSRLTLSQGATNSIVIDDLVHAYTPSSYPVGTCFADVTGVMSLDETSGIRPLLPRSAADLTVGACP